jgi:hypothetical protein
MAQLTDARRARYRQELEASDNTSFIKIPLFKLQEGSTRVRVLPGIEPGSLDKDFYCKSIVHYGVSPSNPKIPVISPRSKNPNAKCPLNDKVRELKDSSSPADNAEAVKLRGLTRYYISVIPREGEDQGKIMVYPAPKAIFTKILALMDDPEYGDVTSATEGRDLKFLRTGKGKDTRYDVMASPKVTPITHDPEELAQILEGQPEIWRYREAPSYDEIVKFMDGEITQFTTGGFASKKATDPHINAALTEEEVEASDDFLPVKEVAPKVAEKATKKFSNLDKIKKELADD